MGVVARELLEPNEAPTWCEQVVALCRLFLLFLKNSYGLNSMDPVATDTKVSKRTVYTYFKNKDSPLIDIMEDMSYLFGKGALGTIKFDGPPDKLLRESARILLVKELAPNSQHSGPYSCDYHPGRRYAGDGAKTLG
jgi:hypothetical protein